MINENYCILTGILIKKDRNANNLDIKRPVLDIEFVSTCGNTQEIQFEKVPVLLSDYIVAKSVSAYRIGDILTITGRIRMDDGCGIYIEADSVVTTLCRNNKVCGIAISRADLLQLTQRFNLVSAIGTIRIQENSEIIVPRSSYTKGDLKNEDKIPVILSPPKGILNDARAVITGELRSQGKELCLYANRIFLVSLPEEKSIKVRVK